MLKAHPKPEPRKRQKQRASFRLADHRRQQALRAKDRDSWRCQICADKGVTTRALDVHHIFGRGRTKGDWRENYMALLCVCRACHPAPLYSHDWKSDHEIVALARRINGKEVSDG